jgi:hypothetical protein
VRLDEGEQHRAELYLTADVGHGRRAYDPPVPPGDLVRMVPVLTGTDLEPMVIDPAGWLVRVGSPAPS